MWRFNEREKGERDLGEGQLTRGNYVRSKVAKDYLRFRMGGIHATFISSFFLAIARYGVVIKVLVKGCSHKAFSITNCL